MSIISLHGLTKPEALAALFNYANPQGLGMLHYKPDHMMDSLEAGIVLTQGMYVDYLEGRVIKVDFGRFGDTIDTRLYDMDNGIDAGLKAIRYAIDKKDGGFMGDISLPLHIGMSEIRRRERPGMIWYEYENFMGGELRVFRLYISFTEYSKYKVEYANREIDLVAARSITEDYFRRGEAGYLFKRLVREVVVGFVSEILNKGEKEPV